MRHLIVGGVTVPLRAGIGPTQTYEADDAVNDERMGDRSLRRQTYGARKIATEVRGRGIIPPALQALDTSQALTISCIAPMAINSASPNIALPTTRRSDAGSVPFGRAFIGDRLVATPVVMADDTAQLTPVTGATAYQALYFPEFLAMVTLGRTSHASGGAYDWTLTAREV